MRHRSRKPLLTDEPPREMTLYPSRKAWLPVLLISIAFTAVGIWNIPEGEGMAWAASIFFGLGTVVSGLIVCFPKMTSLRLTDEGFIIQSLFRGQLVRWDDVSFFGVTSVGGPAMVGFSFVVSYAGQKFGRQLARDLCGYDGALPDTYGMTADNLADLLNTWKKRTAESRAVK
jgi:hypothetical protein